VDGLLSATQQVLILRNALVLSGQPEFGLMLGKRLTPATHGAMGFAASSSPNLLSALQAIHIFLPTRVSVIELNLQQVETHLECTLHFRMSLDADIQRCMADTIIKVLLEFGEFIIGRPLNEAEIFFPHQAPEYHALYSDYLSGQILFNCDHLKLRLPMALCLEPNASANHESYRFALQQCESMLAQLQTHKPSYQTRIKKMMLSRPPGTLNEDEAAASLFMSKRTMARKLKEENTGFRQIRDEIMSQQAASYLCDSRLVFVNGSKVCMRLTPQAWMFADSEKREVSTSILYSLADSASGLAVFAEAQELTPIATLSLHMDYLRPAVDSHSLLAVATCRHLMDDVAFIYCEIFCEGDDVPLATGSATFIRNTQGQRFQVAEASRGRA
jgi:hypothetical protein